MIKVTCVTCGKEFGKYPSEVCEHNFCCLGCRLEWWGKWTVENMNLPGHTKGHKAPHLTKYNKTQNPKNKKRHDNYEMMKGVNKNDKKRRKTINTKTNV